MVQAASASRAPCLLKRSAGQPVRESYEEHKRTRSCCLEFSSAALQDSESPTGYLDAWQSDGSECDGSEGCETNQDFTSHSPLASESELEITSSSYMQLHAMYPDADAALLSPGDSVPFQKVSEEARINVTANNYGFSQCAIALGTSYFRRICRQDIHLWQAAIEHEDFAAYAPSICLNSAVRPTGSALHREAGSHRWLIAVHMTCIFIASKVVERPAYPNVMQHILGLCHCRKVSAQQVADIEMCILQMLDWRLSPYFEEGEVLY